MPVKVHSYRANVERFEFDSDYLDRLTRGDAEVERHFTGYFGQLLLIKLRSRLNCPQQVADARQETFVRVFAALRKKGTILHPERLGAFVNSVCEHVVLESFRAGSRTTQMPEFAPDPIDQRDSAEFEMITAERKRLVRETLAQLSEADRTLIRGVFLEERDRDELCRELGIDRDYLRVRLHRALARFRSCLDQSSPARTFRAGGLS